METTCFQSPDGLQYLMLKSFLHKGLSEFWETGRTSRIDKGMHERVKRRLDALDQALQPTDLALPGFDFHPLRGFDPTRYTIHVNGPWCITFEFDAGDVVRVDFEQYH
jgi:toxin HigB-1